MLSAKSLVPKIIWKGVIFTAKKLAFFSVYFFVPKMLCAGGIFSPLCVGFLLYFFYFPFFSPPFLNFIFLQNYIRQKFISVSKKWCEDKKREYFVLLDKKCVV